MIDFEENYNGIDTIFFWDRFFLTNKNGNLLQKIIYKMLLTS